MTKVKVKLPPFSWFQPCSTLTPDKKCVRLRKYNHGEGESFTELFHEHCPAYRISDDSSIELLRALVLRYQEAEGAYILRCYLNKRGREPRACNLRVIVEYPEPGVLRRNYGTDIHAWIDTVINPKKFRRLQKTAPVVE